MNNKKLYMSLAYLGALPFIFSAVLLSAHVQHLFILGDVLDIANAYALVIVVFMSGIHWGTYLCDERSNSLNLLIASNVITVFSWLAFLVLSPLFVFTFYALAFIILLFIDFKLFSLDVITKHYLFTRCVVTSIVVASLITIALSLQA